MSERDPERGPSGFGRVHCNMLDFKVEFVGDVILNCCDNCIKFVSFAFVFFVRIIPRTGMLEEYSLQAKWPEEAEETKTKLRNVRLGLI